MSVTKTNQTAGKQKKNLSLSVESWVALGKLADCENRSRSNMVEVLIEREDKRIQTIKEAA